MKVRLIHFLYLFLFLKTFAYGDDSGSSEARVTSEMQFTFPFSELRGYGEVAGKSWKSDGGGCVLEIYCESVEKARLTQSKYVADLMTLPGVDAVEVDLEDARVQVYSVRSQGVVAVVQKRDRVLIVTAANIDELKATWADFDGGSLAGWSSKPSAEIPMWLNRWDQHGFRFYYRPWALPKGESRDNYDFSEEFAFAEKNDHAGIIHWAGMDNIDTAAGRSNDPWWSWAQDAAKAKDLPVGLNIMFGGAGKGYFLNRFREQTAEKMPHFSGGFHGKAIASPHLGGNGLTSFSATYARDAELAELQEIVAEYAKDPNLVTVLEPHGEFRHGIHHIFHEYGSLADETFHDFLRNRYGSLSGLNVAWDTDYARWDQVHVPEVASFLGWGDDALDLAGEWRIQYEPFRDGENFSNRELESSMRNKPVPTQGAEGIWFAEDFDDSEWPTVIAPGHDRTMFLPQRPAVYRKTFDVDPEWLDAHENAWLYLWDLNSGTRDRVKIVLNGDTVSETDVQHAHPHWVGVDVGALLRAKGNQLSIRLPKGFLAYRVYLSPDPLVEYPHLGEGLNAQWVDFIDWTEEARIDTLRRSVEMIRDVAPNQQIVFMAPDYFADGVKELARDYGGNFHNTGYMGAFYADYLPSLMRGADLPFSLEPGGPARDLPGFKKQLGLYSTEGIQGIDYFIHIGSVMWNPEMRAHFEEVQPLINLLGKYHGPEAEVAALYPTKSTGYTTYPWGKAPNSNLGSGYWKWNVRAYLDGYYESDGLTESSFADGDAEKYRVIIDTNTSIMTPELLSEIERYVRDGGTFVTFAQTGRHTPTQPNGWAISELTGFRVAGMDQYDEDGNPLESHGMRPAPGYDVFHGDWENTRANGLFLEAIVPEAKPLMLWDNGQVAVGVRPLGKGHIIQVGCKFTGEKMADRLEPNPRRDEPDIDSRSEPAKALTRFLGQLMNRLKVSPVPMVWEPENHFVKLRHFESNNGLYDVWIAWNQSPKVAAEGAIVISGSENNPGWAMDVLAGQEIAVENGRIPVLLEPMETRAYLTPKNQLCRAPVEWLDLQRKWWRAPVDLRYDKLEPISWPDARDLSDNWAFLALTGDEDIHALTGSDVDDSDWPRIDMGIWSFGEQEGVSHALLRKTFTVPEDWVEGEPTFWLQSRTEPTFMDRARMWLNGEPVLDWRNNGINNLNPGNQLQPGTTHTVTLEIEGVGPLVGARGGAWLWFWNEPSTAIDLGGTWQVSQDFLDYTQTQQLPGSYEAAALRRSVDIPESARGQEVYLSAETSGRLVGVLVNGHWVRRFHHLIGDRYELNITRWIEFGEENEIEMASMDGPTHGEVKWIRLDFREKEDLR